jgi:hypothetical protein
MSRVAGWIFYFLSLVMAGGRRVVISIKSAGSWGVKSENLKKFLLLLL